MRVNRSLVGEFEKLRWHRCLVVEAMREIAFRNRDHFYVASVRLGLSDRADSEAVTLIFDKMLEDQEVKPTEANRWVLGWANRGSWEVYMCLLHSLVEDYERMRRTHPSAAFAPLDDFLQLNEELVEELKAVRDKLLHPQSRTDYNSKLGSLGNAARQVAPDLYFALEELQSHLDDFLEQLQGVLQQALGEEVAELPPGEMAVYFQRFMQEVRSLAESTGNTDLLADMDRKSGEMEAHRQVILSHMDKDSSLDDVPLGRIERLEATRSAINLPLPKRPYAKSADSVQTPVVLDLVIWVMAASRGGQVATLEQRLTPSLMEHRGGILELLVRSITIFNETHVAIAARYKLAFPDLSFEQVIADEELFEEAMRQSIPTDAGAEWERAMLETAPFSIALALLAEPLRIYRDVIRNTPELSRNEIDSDTLDQAEEALRKLRNTIFHVPRGQTDTFDADTELAHAPISHGDFLNLVAAMTYFWQGTDPDTLFKIE